MGGTDRIIDKMTSIVDGNELVEKSGGALAESGHVADTMARGDGLYGHTDTPFVPCDIGGINLPYLPEFVRKYPNFLRPKD